MLACLSGAESAEDQAQAKRQANQKKAEAEKEKKKQSELKKVDKMKKEQEEEKREQEKRQKEVEELAAQGERYRVGKQAAWDQTVRSIEELTNQIKGTTTPEEAIATSEKLKEAVEMKKKLEKEGMVVSESKVGEEIIVVGNKVMRVARIILAHMQSIDSKGKMEVQEGVNKANALLREKAITEGNTPWHVTAEVGKGERDDESRWMVNKMADGITKREVLNLMSETLTAVFGAKGDMLNCWMEDGLTIRMLMPVAPSKVARGRKDMGKKLREDNKDMKVGHRFPKLWGGARTTGLTFDAANVEEAKRLVASGVVWEGVKRQVQIVDTNKMGEFKHSPTIGRKTEAASGKKTGGIGKKPQQQHQQQQKTQRGNQFSSMQCFNCKGFGHKKESCSSASRVASANIIGVQKRNLEAVGANQNGQQTQKKKKEEPKLDKDGFEIVDRKKGWNVWNKPKGQTKPTAESSNTRISEVLDDDVEDSTPWPTQKPPQRSDWSQDQQPGLVAHRF